LRIYSACIARGQSQRSGIETLSFSAGDLLRKNDKDRESDNQGNRDPFDRRWRSRDAGGNSQAGVLLSVCQTTKFRQFAKPRASEKQEGKN
jgi:hypothetical protein